jgi:hypothetical protein
VRPGCCCIEGEGCWRLGGVGEELEGGHRQHVRGSIRAGNQAGS